MALVNNSKREINAKLVYYGPGLSGKTTSLNHVYSKLKPEFRGKLKTMNVQGDKMLFFDFTPPGDGNVNGFSVRLHIYTLNGEPAGPAPWKMVLKGADGIVFVADSSPERMTANRQCLEDLNGYLNAHGQNLQEIPLVFAYNKRDRADAVPVADMQRLLNQGNCPAIPIAASKGDGVLNALLTLVKAVLNKLREAGTDLGGAISPPQDRTQQPHYDLEDQAGELPAASEDYVITPASDDFASGQQAATFTEMTAGDPEVSFAGNVEMIAPGHLRVPLLITTAGKTKTLTLDLSLS